MRALRELLIGARMAVAGGAAGWVRAGLTAVGVGVGVAMLLVAVSVPAAIEARDTRQAARDSVGFVDAAPPPSDRTMLVSYRDTEFHQRSIRAILLQPDGAHPPVPPGLTSVPGPGQMAVSPALARLLAEPDAGLLRERLDYRVVATIGPAGLVVPGELVFYLGTADLDAADDSVNRRSAFDEKPWRSGPDPMLSLIVIVVVVVLLLPVGLFVAAAIRFGGEARDRRLAGVRLLGADARMTRRIGAGEALASAGLGLVVGAAIFATVRSFVDRFELFGLSAFPDDLRPDPVLTAILALAVPGAAVLVTLLSLRRVVVEPLGVVRRSGDVRRRVWWRALLPVLGLALLLPLRGAISRGEHVSEVRVGAGLALMLVGVAALLPWAVQATVGRLRAGSPAWQLAVRRLQLDATTASRGVVGIAVAVAGAIGLQTLFVSVAGTGAAGAGSGRVEALSYYEIRGGWDQVQASDARMSGVDGVGRVDSEIFMTAAAVSGDWYGVSVAECPALRLIAVISSCTEGDVFILSPSAETGFGPVPVPGAMLLLDADPGADRAGTAWRVPEAATQVTQSPPPGRGWTSGLLATPSALPEELMAARSRNVTSYVELDRADPDAVERLRNAAWPAASVRVIGEVEDDAFASVRRALFAGATVTLVLIGVSLLVSMLDQLRERRRVLAGLVALGIRRSTLVWSIFWQAAVPVALGLALAVAAGLGVGWALLRIAAQPMSIDWPIVGLVSSVAALVVLGVTTLSTPVLLRLMRADGLRSE